MCRALLRFARRHRLVVYADALWMYQPRIRAWRILWPTDVTHRRTPPSEAVPLVDRRRP